MMEKTIDQIREEVLAYCQQLCPESELGRVSISGGKLYIERINPPEYGKSWWIGVYSWRSCIVCIGKYSTEHEFSVAHIVLGLDSRAKEQETLIKALRSFTGCSSADCRAALDDNEWDCYKATVMIRSSGPTVKQIIAEATKDKNAEIERLCKEVERLKAVSDVWNPVSAMAAITESLKLANQEAEIARLRDMLKAVVSHAKEPAMSDGQFRQFAIENCEYTLKGGDNV